MKKFVSVLVAAMLVLSAAVMLTACSESEFPVEIGTVKIEKTPKKVVVLDDVTADILAYMNFNRLLVGKSDIVTQEELASVPSVGTETNPDVRQIEVLGADLVFCNEKLSKETEQQLKKAGIPVLKMQTPRTVGEVKVNYETIAKALVGKNKGMRTGKESYSRLELDLERIEHSVDGYFKPSDNVTICYLYLDDKKLACLTNGNYGDILMQYTNCKNIFSYDDATPDSPTALDVAKELTAANPTFILYNDDATLKALTSDKNLSKLKALSAKRTLQIPLQKMSLPGVSAQPTLNRMIEFIYAGKLPTTAPVPTPVTDVTSGTNTTLPGTTAAKDSQTNASAATAPAATEPQDVSAQYKITLKDLKLEKNNENDNVRIMQQRLFDLGYIKKSGDDTNITGYYGDVTETAVKAFQKANGIKETGTADNATLVLLFSSAAKKAG